MSQTERVIYILDRLKEENRIRTAEVAGEFEVDPRTVKRDIEYIRERLGYPMVWSPRERQYRLEGGDLEKLRRRGEGELMFYALAMGFRRNTRLMPLVSRSIEDHLSGLLPPEYRELSEHISYDLFDYPEPPPRFFSLLLRAIAGKRRLHLVYDSRGGIRSERKIDPLHLKNWNGQWYLAARCHTREEMRLFLMSRMVSLATLGETFVPFITQEELKRRLDGGFGIMADLNREGVPDPVKIRFTGDACELTRGVVWHPSQREETDGRTRTFTFPASSYQEVLNLVFSYREEAEVLEPGELREIWLEKIRKMANRYL